MPKIEVKDGTPSNRWYVIEYDEDQWFRYDEDGKQFCYDTWIKKATPISDIDMVVLRLIPDPVFPRSDKELPYIEWQHCIDRRPQEAFKYSAEVRITLDTAYVELDVPTRNAIERKLREYPNGTNYFVMDSANNQLLSGKVSK